MVQGQEVMKWMLHSYEAGGLGMGPLRPESMVYIQVWSSGHSTDIQNSLWLFVKLRIGQMGRAGIRIC